MDEAQRFPSSCPSSCRDELTAVRGTNKYVCHKFRVFTPAQSLNAKVQQLGGNSDKNRRPGDLDRELPGNCPTARLLSFGPSGTGCATKHPVISTDGNLRPDHKSNPELDGLCRGDTE
jgi:hypothetical protein